MKTKLTNIRFWLFTGSIVIFCTLLIFRFLKNDHIQVSNQSMDFHNIANHFAILKGNLLLQLSSDGHKVTNIGINNTEELRVNDIVKDSPYLVFRFSSNHCISCIEHAMEVMELLIGEFDFDRLIFLAQYENIRAYNLFLRNNKLNMDMYNIQEDLGIPSESFGVPYFFILMPDLTTYSTFIPIKEIELYTYRSLRAIIRNLNSHLIEK